LPQRETEPVVAIPLHYLQYLHRSKPWIRAGNPVYCSIIQSTSSYVCRTKHHSYVVILIHQVSPFLSQVYG